MQVNPSLSVQVRGLTLRAKVNDPRALFFVVLILNRPLPELSNLLSATQARQVSATKDHVSRAVLATRLIDQRRVARHPFAIFFTGCCATLVSVSRQARN